MEVYARSSAFPRDAIMLNVDSIEAALTVAAEFGIQATTDLKDAGDTRFLYITDPDGRPVMLVEKK